MLNNIDINQMNRLMEENKDAKQIITQLLENYHTSVSMIAHEIRNPLTLVSSSLQIMEAQHPEVKNFHNWDQTMEDIRFMCDLLNELSTLTTAVHSITLYFLLRNFSKILPYLLQSLWTQRTAVSVFPQRSCRVWAISPAIKLNWKRSFSICCKMQGMPSAQRAASRFLPNVKMTLS